jgi:transglutaminase-like putative cysteine protease
MIQLMKRYLLLLSLCCQTALAQLDYKATSIPAALLENAHGVVRHHETTFTVRSVGEAVQRTHSVVTVLDQEGDEHATMVVPYDKLSKVTNFEGALYDANGQLIKKLKNADIKDYSTYTDYNLFDDQRIKAARFPKQPMYPYTVEFIVETSERNLMFYPTWIPQREEHLAVERALFTITMPPAMTLRYKETNLPGAVVAKPTVEGGKQYTWQVTSLAAVELEPFSPPGREQLPIVYTAPAEFEVQSYRGSLTSWNDLALFYHKLNAERDQIPETLRKQVLELTAGEKTTAGKVHKLYSFLQDHTRYVSVQLGIGGWQTIEASQVANSKYGDCKALTNYMAALLKTAGVKAYPALVRAGSNAPDALTDFPSFQFNHVILCVPDGRDTTFLECTSGHGKAGYIGDFTGNRHVLLITPSGGKLIKTPAYRSSENRQQRRILVSVTDQGDATADVHSQYSGLQQDDYVAPIHQMSQDAQRNWLLKRVSIPAFELTTYSLAEQPGSLPIVTETMNLAVRRWATTSGTRLFLPLNLLSALPPAAPLTKDRKTPLDLGTTYEFEGSDTITYQLPKGYTPEYQLAPLTIESKFGRYSTQVSVSGERLTYVRHLTMHKGRYPASAYTEWVDFRKKIAKADRAQMVFVKSN